MSLHPDYKGKYEHKWSDLPNLKLSGLEPLNLHQRLILLILVKEQMLQDHACF